MASRSCVPVVFRLNQQYTQCSRSVPYFSSVDSYKDIFSAPSHKRIPSKHLSSQVAYSSSTTEGHSSLGADKFHRLIIWKCPPPFLPNLYTALSLWTVFQTLLWYPERAFRECKISWDKPVHLGKSENVIYFVYASRCVNAYFFSCS